jgi:ribonuclease Z
MLKRHVAAASLTCLAIMFLGQLGTSRHFDLALNVHAQVAGPSPFRVILLGTGGTSVQRLGISTLVEAGTMRLLFDCGRAPTVRMAQLGISPNTVTKVFLTHLHSDHVIGIPDLLLTGWAMSGRRTPLEVWGPDGTTAMMDYLQKAFEFDIHVRRDVDERFPGEGIRVISHDIKQGVVFEKDGLTVTAFLVDHGPVAPAFGYRVDYRGHSVALSGDTKPSENLIRFAQGVDVLVHEAIDPEAFRVGAAARNQTSEQVKKIISHHRDGHGSYRYTTPEQAGEVFSRVKPRLAVFSHAGNSETLIARTKKTYSGRVEPGEDMITIDVGDAIEVRRFGK